MPASFRFPVGVRYLEVDAQGVVFNMWYLGWFDEAMTAFLAHGGLTYTDMPAAGYDVQLVRSEVDWSAAVGFGDEVAVQVDVDRIGSTSFTLRFTVLRAGTPTAVGRTTYVVVRTDGGGKLEIPARLRDLLEAAASLAP